MTPRLRIVNIGTFKFEMTQEKFEWLQSQAIKCSISFTEADP